MTSMVLDTPRISFFFFNDTATTEIYTLSLHDALPISQQRCGAQECEPAHRADRERRAEHASQVAVGGARSEEHTSELQSPCNLVCRLLLEKKKKAQTDEQQAEAMTGPQRVIMQAVGAK